MSSAASPIHKHMRVLDIITLCPESEQVIAEYGLHCFNCSANAEESLVDGCLSHGFEEDEIDELVDDINQLLRDRPERPMILTVTAPAACAIREIAVAEGKADAGLTVTADGRGGFCLEFSDSPGDGHLVFWSEEEPDVKIDASPLTLQRLGGSTIDFRDGKFKLDLPDEARGCGCSDGSGCGCKT